MNLLQSLSHELESLVARASPAVVSVAHRGGRGSGMVLAQDGYVLTNCHVVRGATRPRVGFSDGSELRAQVVGLDAQTDLGVLRVEATGLPSLAIADGEPRVGQLVVAIGNPLVFERSVSLGVVSALDRSLPGPAGSPFEGLVQTDAAINPGNSGGPLVDVQGAVVGINTAIVPFAQGIGFAIPARTAAWVTAVLMRSGRIERPFLGVSARSMELPARQAREVGQARAIRVFTVGSGTPADRGGLREGDVVVSANGSAVASVDDLQRVMVLGDLTQVQLEVIRGAGRHQLDVRPDRRAQAA